MVLNFALQFLISSSWQKHEQPESDSARQRTIKVRDCTHGLQRTQKVKSGRDVLSEGAKAGPGNNYA